MKITSTGVSRRRRRRDGGSVHAGRGEGASEVERRTTVGRREIRERVTLRCHGSDTINIIPGDDSADTDEAAAAAATTGSPSGRNDITPDTGRARCDKNGNRAKREPADKG